jgi:Arc/MetJ family transcription regulator
MSNVISLEDHPKAQAAGWASAREREAIAAELSDLMDRIRAAAARITGLPGEPLQVQQAAQHLLDAITAIERAADRLAADPGNAPPRGNSEA